MIGIHGWGAFIPLHNIARVESRQNEHKVDLAIIHTVDGGTEKTAAVTWDAFSRSAVQLIPVMPGMSMIRLGIYADDPQDWWLEREPIIAWALCVDGEMRPATPAGVWDGQSWESDPGPFVEMPDGKVINSWPHGDYGGFADVDEMARQLLKDAGKDPTQWRSTKAVPL